MDSPTNEPGPDPGQAGDTESVGAVAADPPDLSEASDDSDGNGADDERGDDDGAEQPKRGSFLRELPVLVLTGVLLVVLLKAFVVSPFYIPSASMETTLLCNDRVLVSRFSYVTGGPARGDVVVFRPWPSGGDYGAPSAWGWVVTNVKEGIGISSPDGPALVKRVVGLPGDTIEVVNSRAVVNGEPLEESYVFVDGFDAVADFGPVTVPEGQYFLMGDHRNRSSDSRQGQDGRFVTRDQLIGEAFLRMWPPGRIGSLRGPKSVDDAPNCT